MPEEFIDQAHRIGIAEIVIEALGKQVVGRLQESLLVPLPNRD